MHGGAKGAVHHLLLLQQPEDGAALLLIGPRDRREVRIWTVATGEDLIASAHGIEKVDGVAAGEAVTGGTNVDGHAVIGQDVGRSPNVIPIVEPEGEVMQAAVRTLNERNVMRLGGTLEEGNGLVALAVE